MKVLVTGANGQLGHDVSDVLRAAGHTVISASHEELDVTDAGSVQVLFRAEMPDAVVHCAAWTAVDLAEDFPERCRDINVHGTENIVNECMRYDVPVVYISTDYVFDGRGDKPRDIQDEVDPINQYGMSKAEGESIVLRHAKHFIIRTSWVFGSNGKNFVKTMVRLTSGDTDVKVVDDQFGSPTYTIDLAQLISAMIVTERYGIYHAHNEGFCSWYEFACEIFALTGTDKHPIPVNTDGFPVKALRPKNSRLSTSSLTDAGFELLPDWQDALRRFLVVQSDCEPKDL